MLAYVYMYSILTPILSVLTGCHFSEPTSSESVSGQARQHSPLPWFSVGSSVHIPRLRTSPFAYPVLSSLCKTKCSLQVLQSQVTADSSPAMKSSALARFGSPNSCPAICAAASSTGEGGDFSTSPDADCEAPEAFCIFKASGNVGCTRYGSKFL